MSVNETALLTRIATATEITDGGSDAFAVTPHNSTNFATSARALYVGVTGNVVVVAASGAVTFTAVPAGGIIPVRCTRVNSTGTTASAIVGIT